MILATDESGTIEIEYSVVNQLTRIAYPTGHFFNYSYDDAGRLIQRVDQDGNVLDRKTEMFRLGVSSGEIVSFTATPEYFDIGDEIEIEMAFRNNGTVNITGTAIIRVLNSTGYATEEFRHNVVTNLTPSESISFSDEWDTSGAEGGSYKILGYVLYDSTATEPVSVTVSTQAKIFDTGPDTYPSVRETTTAQLQQTKQLTYPNCTPIPASARAVIQSTPGSRT